MKLMKECKHNEKTTPLESFRSSYTLFTFILGKIPVIQNLCWNVGFFIDMALWAIVFLGVGAHPRSTCAAEIPYLSA